MKNWLTTHKYLLGILGVLLFTIGMFSLQVIGVQETLTDPDTIEAGLALSQILPTAPPSAYAKLVIVIDDFGQSREGVVEMLALPTKLTTAIMPFFTYTQEDALAATAAGHEVIIHVPFYTKEVPVSWLGPRIINTSMGKQEVESYLEDAFTQLPMAKGINNHIGPFGCESSFISDCVLAYLSAHGKYLIDSGISSTSDQESSAKTLAGLYGMEDSVFQRTFFLDGTAYPTVDATKEQLRKAATVAKESGLAIVIGHVGPEGGVRTAQAISEMLPWLTEQNVTIVTLSEIIGAG